MNYLIVGLGNIGAEYENTRHNMGFIVLDAWAKASNTVFSPGRYGSVAEVGERGHKLTLLKPSTFMNLSGKAVRYWMQEKKIPLERVVVLCDDLNLPFGTVRMRPSGSAGGHNGLKNIEEFVGSSSYARVRMGIGNDYARGAQIDFVLGRLSQEELASMENEIAPKVIQGVKLFVTQGIGKAMTIMNCKAPTENKAPAESKAPAEK